MDPLELSLFLCESNAWRHQILASEVGPVVGDVVLLAKHQRVAIVAVVVFVVGKDLMNEERDRD